MYIVYVFGPEAFITNKLELELELDLRKRNHVVVGPSCRRTFEDESVVASY